MDPGTGTGGEYETLKVERVNSDWRGYVISRDNMSSVFVNAQKKGKAISEPKNRICTKLTRFLLVCLIVCLPVSVGVIPANNKTFTHPSINSSRHQSIHGYLRSFINPSIHSSFHPSIYPSIHSFIHSSIHK